MSPILCILYIATTTIHNMEQYVDIKGYEGQYQVSNQGNVRSIDRVVNNRNIKGKTLKPMMRRDGYNVVDLRRGKERKLAPIHRLVAQAFIDNPDNLGVVNHKDGDKTNNAVYNLEWVTQQGNMKHAYDNNINDHKVKANKILKEGAKVRYYKRIVLTKDGETHEFKDTHEVAAFLGMSQKTVSGKMYRGRIGGYDIKAYK